MGLSFALNFSLDAPMLRVASGVRWVFLASLVNRLQSPQHTCKHVCFRLNCLCDGKAAVRRQTGRLLSVANAVSGPIWRRKVTHDRWIQARELVA